ncbi:MAG: hypothetical protein WBQ32_01440 [Ignavibacteriaceae bacterium]
MKKINKLSSVFGYLALTSGSIWFGAYIARLVATYQMYEETEPVFKTFINSTNLPAIVEILAPLIYLTFITYLIMIVCFTLFLFASHLKLKENGWLFIIAAIIYLTLPFETFLLVDDYKLIVFFLNEQFSSEMIVDLITDRLYRLSSFPIIQILSYFSIPYLLIFRPLVLKIKDEN